MLPSHRLAIAATVSLGSFCSGALADVVSWTCYSGINEAGVIVGSMGIDERLVPVMWPSDGAEPVVLLHDFGAVASGINAHNDIVGSEFRDSSGVRFPVLWSGGDRYQLPDLGEGGSAWSIDDSGTIFGAILIDGQVHTASWQNLQLSYDPNPERILECCVECCVMMPREACELPMPNDGRDPQDPEIFVNDPTDVPGMTERGMFSMMAVPAPGAIAMIGLAAVGATRRRTSRD